ncbi:MAG: DUF4430 domain-containing protein [Clostridiales Family XIII bacterium]|nr:DUF4430 domain-containing protein [Clostridiales Family XIII bacterium]
MKTKITITVVVAIALVAVAAFWHLGPGSEGGEGGANTGGGISVSDGFWNQGSPGRSAGSAAVNGYATPEEERAAVKDLQLDPDKLKAANNAGDKAVGNAGSIGGNSSGIGSNSSGGPSGTRPPSGGQPAPAPGTDTGSPGDPKAPEPPQNPQPPGAPETPENPQAQSTCTIYIECTKVLIPDNWKNLKQSKVPVVPADGVILAKRTVSFSEGESVFDLLLRETKNNRIHMEFVSTPAYNSAYIKGIANIYEFDCGNLSGWIYSVNGLFPNYGCSQYQLQEGDTVEWHFTCDLGQDFGLNF